MPKMHLFSGMDNRQTADSLRCQQNILLVVQKRTPGKHTSWYGKILAMISGVYISQLVRQISEPINQLVPSSKVFSSGLFWAKVLHGSTICFCFISTTVYVSDIFRLCTVKAGDVGLFSFFNLSEVSEASTVWLCQCLFGWIPSFKILLCYFRNKSIGSICVSPKSFFFCNHLSGARAKYVKTACVASAAVSSCKFQEAYKVDRELNEWTKNTIFLYSPHKSFLARCSFWWVFFKSKGCIWEDKHMEFPTWWWWVLTTHNGESECGIAWLISFEASAKLTLYDNAWKQKRSNCEFTSQICQADGKGNDHRDQGKDSIRLRNDIFLEDMNLLRYWESHFEAGGWCILPTREASWSLNLKSPQNLTTSGTLPRLHVRYTWALSWFLRSRSNKKGEVR